MMSLIDIVLAQAAATPTALGTDPITTVVTTLGGSAGVLILWQVVKPFVEAWGTGIKKRLGDTEMEAKYKTRAMIHDLTETMTKMAEQQQIIAEIQRQTLKELENFRRENDMQHDHLHSSLGRLK